MSDAERSAEAGETVEERDGPKPASRRGATAENLPEEHRPNVPHAEDDERTDWSKYTAYCCVICRDNCINRIESVYARARECRHCFVVPTLDRHSVDDLDER